MFGASEVLSFVEFLPEPPLPYPKMSFFCFPSIRTNAMHPSQKKRKQGEEASDIEKQKNQAIKRSKKNERRSKDRTGTELTSEETVVADDCREDKSRLITTHQPSPLRCDTEEEEEQSLTRNKTSQDPVISPSNDQSKGIGQSSLRKEQIKISSASDDGNLNQEMYQSFNLEHENGQSFQIEEVKPESDPTTTGDFESEDDEPESEDDEQESGGEKSVPEGEESESVDEDPESDPTMTEDFESEDVEPELDLTRTTGNFESEDDEPESDPTTTTGDFESNAEILGHPGNFQSPDATNARQPTDDEKRLSRGANLANFPSKCPKILALDENYFHDVANLVYETSSPAEKSLLLGQSSSDEEEFDDSEFVDRLFEAIDDIDAFTLVPAQLDNLDDEVTILKSSSSNL